MKRVLLVGAVGGAGLLVGFGWVVMFLADVMDRAEAERDRNGW